MAGGTGQAMPFASAGATDSIPEMAPLAFDQIIIAGGDEDVTAVELFEWVAPLLAGIPGGRWMSCQIDIAETGEVLKDGLASYRHVRGERRGRLRSVDGQAFKDEAPAGISQRHENLGARVEYRRAHD